MLRYLAPLLLSGFVVALTNPTRANAVSKSPVQQAALVKSSMQTSVALGEFQAQFQLFRDGKQLGTASISLAKLGGGYRFSTKSQSEGGVASLVGGASIQETSDFLWQQGRIVPQRYAYEQRISFKKKQREIRFDWEKQRAREDNGDSVTNFLIIDGALDRHVVVLAIAHDLLKREASTPMGLLTHPVANKGSVETWQFRAAGIEKLSTPLGDIDAEKIERVRQASGNTGKPQRETTSWHAAQFGYLPVRILQREPDGETLEMRLSSIQVQPAVAPQARR